MIRYRHTLSFAAIAALGTAVHAESLTIAELAPRETFLVAGLDDASASFERFKQTGLWALYQADEMGGMREQIEEYMDDGPAMMLEELDLDPDDLRWPKNAVGVAMYVVMGEDGMPAPGFLLSADYGDEAEHVVRLIDAAKRAVDENDEVSYEEQDVRGRTVISFEMGGDEEPAAGIRDPFAPAPADDFGAGSPEDAFEEALETLHVVRDNGLFLVANDLDALRGALERCDGEGAGLSQRPDYQGLIGQLGEHDAFGAILIGELTQMLGAVDPMGMMMMLMPMVQQVVGDIQGAGMGVRLDSADAMVEQTYTAYMPYGKAGLTSLMENATPFGELPAFVGPNTISFSQINFDFQGLPAALQPLVQMAMMMAPPQQPGEGPQMNELIEQVASCFGEKIYAIQSVDRPINETSLKQVMVAECTKPRELEALIQQLGAGAGLEGRDFVGHRLYTIDLDLGAMVPMGDVAALPSEPPAIGLAGGYFFAGPTSAVEQALRSIGHENNASLSDEKSFQRALASLGTGRAVAWGYSNLVDTAEATMKMNEFQMERMKAALEAEGVDISELDEPMGAWMKDLDADFFRKHIGPVAWKMVATDEGFVVNSFLLEGEGHVD